MSLTLILTRHAKSSWDDPMLEDHDRPLNKRGRKSAQAISGWLRNNNWLPDEVLSSTSTRTRETWDRMELEADKICFHRSLYLADPQAMLIELSGATEPTVLLLGHNPGIAEFAQRILRDPPTHARFRDYPTCATTVMRFPFTDWADIDWYSADPLGFAIPRELINQ